MPKLPKVSPFVVDAITDMLVSEQGMLRPPEKAAALLAVICELHESGQPFPRRQEVAAHIGGAVSGVDRALSVNLSSGYITQEVRLSPGNVQRQETIVRERFYTPSKHLLEVVAKAKRRSPKR